MEKIDINIAGVYRIKCLINGYQYYGQSGSVFFRIAIHIGQLNAGRHINKALQQDWTQYGQSFFRFDLVDRIENATERCKAESSRIANPRLRSKLYNNTIYKRVRRRKARKRAPAKETIVPFKSLSHSRLTKWKKSHAEALQGLH